MIKIINNQFKCKVCINFPEYYFEKATFDNELSLCEILPKSYLDLKILRINMRYV